MIAFAAMIAFWTAGGAATGGAARPLAGSTVATAPGTGAGGAGVAAPTWPGAGGVGAACWVAARVFAVGVPYAAPPLAAVSCAIASVAHREIPASAHVIVNRARALTS